MKTIRITFLLAATAILFTGSASARADEPAATPSTDGARATVAVRTDSPDVTIGYVTEHAAAVASNGASAVGVAWKDVCIAPCQFQLPSGLHELVVTGPGYVGRTERFDLQPGTNKFVVKPGSSLVRWGGWTLAILGVSALVAGVTYAAIGTPSTDSHGNVTTSTPGWAIPVAVAGGAAVAGGLTMVVLSGTSIQRESSGGSTGRGVFVGAGYSGRF